MPTPCTRSRPPERIHAWGGLFALPAKENRDALFDALDALPWRTVPITHTSTDIGRVTELYAIAEIATGDPGTAITRLRVLLVALLS